METYGPKIQEAIKTYMGEAGINATGQTASSVYSNTFETTDSIGIAVGGSKSFATLHTGRRKGAKAPPRTSIEVWMEAKGIGPRNGKSLKSAAFAIARAIGRDGYKGRNISYQASLRIMNALLKDSSAAYIKDIEEHLKNSTSKNVN
jgi:hypothetical protein